MEELPQNVQDLISDIDAKRLEDDPQAETISHVKHNSCDYVLMYGQWVCQ